MYRICIEYHAISLQIQVVLEDVKQDEAHEPECSHVCLWYRCQNTWLCSHAQYLSAIVYLNSLVHVSLVTRLQCGVESAECGVWSVECEVRSVECKVWSGECRVCKV